MALVKVLARNWKLYIFDEANSTTVDNYQKIGGLNSFTIGNDSETTDTTDFDTDGYNTHLISGRSNSLSVEGSYKEDETGARDLGQELVEKLAEKVGAASISKFRIMSPNGTVREFNVSATVGDVGGGVSDTTSWGASFQVSGKPSTIDTATDTAVYNN